MANSVKVAGALDRAFKYKVALLLLPIKTLKLPRVLSCVGVHKNSQGLHYYEMHNYPIRLE